MDAFLDLITAFGTNTTVIAIIAFLAWAVPKLVKSINSINSRLDIMEKTLITVGKTALQLKIVNERMPILERAKAYEIYKSEPFNGNGAVEQLYKEEVEPFLADAFNHEHH